MEQHIGHHKITVLHATAAVLMLFQAEHAGRECSSIIPATTATGGHQQSTIPGMPGIVGWDTTTSSRTGHTTLRRKRIAYAVLKIKG